MAIPEAPTQITLTVTSDEGTRRVYGRLARIIKELLRYESVFGIEGIKGELVIPFKDSVDSKISIAM